MSVVERDSKYTIYKTTVLQMNMHLRDLARKWEPRLCSDAVEVLYRDHYSYYTRLGVSLDKLIWRGVICTYGGELLSEPDMFLASLTCNPQTTVYLVEYREIPNTLITLDHINQISDRMDVD